MSFVFGVEFWEEVNKAGEKRLDDSVCRSVSRGFLGSSRNKNMEQPTPNATTMLMKRFSGDMSTLGGRVAYLLITEL